MGVLSNDQSNSGEFMMNNLPVAKFENMKNRREPKRDQLREVFSNGSCEHCGQIMATRKVSVIRILVTVKII